MKRCALAILSLAAASHALAEDRVSVFGTIDLYMGQTRSGSSRIDRMEDGGNTASRIAFTGTEDLGAGWSTHFMLEAGISPDTGAGNLPGPGLGFSRQSYVGITGPWGSIDVGRQYTPEFFTLYGADPFGVNAVFSTLNIVASTDAQPGMGPFAARASNMIRYRTPSQMSWFLDLGAAAGEGSLPRTLGMTTGYRNGPVYIAYGYQSAEFAGTKSTYQDVSGAYDFSILKVGAHYTRGSSSLSSVATANTVTGSIAVPIGLSQAILEASQRKVSASPRGQFAATLGYDYFLSKRTALYARALMLNNKDKSSASLAQVAVAANSGDDVRVYAVGVRHNF
jgi:predicted porin